MIAFLVTPALTLYMAGMIWCMKVLEYPLFSYVSPKEFPTYHQRHNRGLHCVIIIPSLTALISAMLVKIFIFKSRYNGCSPSAGQDFFHDGISSANLRPSLMVPV